MSNFQKTYLVSPMGRLIQGDSHTVNTTDHRNQPMAENKHNHYFAIAIPKTDPALGAFLGTIQQVAHAGYSAMQGGAGVLPFIEQGLGSGFAWKIDDGDDPRLVKKDGSPKYPEGHPARGCIVVKFSTTLLGTIAAANHLNEPIDPKSIKTGYWVDVSMSVSINGADGAQAGLYINPKTIRLRDYDEEIVSGPSIDQQFGGAAVPAPSNTPPGGVAAAPAPGQNPGMGGMGGMGTTQPPAGGMGTTQPPAGGMGTTQPPAGGMGTTQPPAGGMPGVTPHHGIMDPSQGQTGGMGTTQPPAGGYGNGMPS